MKEFILQNHANLFLTGVLVYMLAWMWFSFWRFNRSRAKARLQRKVETSKWLHN
jgi:hypothetical protein